MKTTHARAASTFQSFYYAFRGVVTGFSEERNFRFQCGYAALVCLLMLWFQPPVSDALLAIVTVMLLLSAELANSALERVVDLICPETNPLAGKAKDLAAAAVMLMSFVSAFTVLVILSKTMEVEVLVGVGGFFCWHLYKCRGRGVRP